MSENGGTRIRVTLRWIQIKDNKEAMWDDEGEFRFRSKVTTAGQTNELEFPEQGYWSISDHPRRNKVDKIDKVLYEGAAGDSLVVELFGVELDQMSANDELEHFVSSDPFDPYSIEALTEEQERYYLASQWKMMWWRLRRHRLAVISGLVLAAMYLSIAAASSGKYSHIRSRKFWRPLTSS